MAVPAPARVSRGHRARVRRLEPSALLLLAVSSVPVAAGAQRREAAASTAAPLVVTGRVTSRQGHALRGAFVVARESPGDSALTDARGRYRLVLPRAALGARLTLRVHAAGMLPRARVVRVARDSQQVDMVLRPPAGHLEPVVVRAPDPDATRWPSECVCRVPDLLEMPWRVPRIAGPIPAPPRVQPEPWPHRP